MSLILEDSNTRGDPRIKPEAKTFSPTLGKPLGSQVWIGDLEIDHADFCALVIYFLTNTDLDPTGNDPRLSLLQTIKEMNVSPYGWNEGLSRIIWNPTNDPDAGKWRDSDEQ